MGRFLVFLLLVSPCFAAHHYELHAPRIAQPVIVEAEPPAAQTHTFPALDTNNAFTGNNTHSGTETFSNAGVFTNAAMNFNLSNLVNSLSPTTEYHAINNNSSLNTTSGGSFGVNVPNTSTVYQANGVEGYAACATINTNCVGGYFQARPLTNGHLSIWGINPVASDIGFTGTTVVAMESDANATSTTTVIQNIQMNGSFTAQPGTALGIRCTISAAQGAGTGRYTSCFSTDMGASNGIGMSLGSIDSGGVHCLTSCNGQQITISGFNAAGTAKSVFLDGDLNGNFRIYPQTGVGIQAASALSPRGILEVSTGGVVPDALNANISHNVNFTDGSNTGMQIGFSDSGTLRGFLQARNNVGANNTAYPLTLNELGGRVLLGTTTDNGADELQISGNVATSGVIKNLTATATMGLTLKKGSGAGNYTNATTSYTVADSTNLCFTVTIPTGWKLGVSASGALATATAAVVAQAALTDNAACSTANAGIIVETAPVQGAGIGVADAFALNWVITGDGAAHNVALQFKTSNVSDTASLINSSATVTPTMKFELMPSN